MRATEDIRSLLKLKCEVVIELPPGHGDPRRAVRTRSIEVFPRDTPQRAQTVTLSVIFERNTDPAPDTPPRNDQEWEAWVRHRVQRAYQTGINLFDHWFEKASVEAHLRTELEADAKRIGRRITQLLIEPVARPLVERETTLQEEVVWRGRWAYAVTFVVRARLKLRKDGAGLYLAKEMPNLSAWLKSKVPFAIDSSMFNRDFADLSEQGERALEAEVLSSLSGEAQEIGHTLELLVLVSRLEERKYLRRFEINEPKRSFPTKHPLVPAKIEIGLVMQLSDLQPHAELFVEKRFEAEVKSLAVQAVERVMKTVEAKEYFANWEPWAGRAEQGSADPVKSKPLRDQLVATIKTEIERRFSPTLLEVQLRRVDNDVSELDSRAQQIPPITVTPSIPAPDVENADQDCEVTVKYRFAGIDPEAAVDIIARGEQPFERGSLAVDLDNWTKACLRRLSQKELLQLNSEQPLVGPTTNPTDDPKQRVMARLKKDVGWELKRAYGLTVDIMYVELHLSEQERLIRDMSSQPIRDARARLDAYESRRTRTLQFFNEDIEAIRTQLKDYDRRIADQTKAAEPDQVLIAGLRSERDELAVRLRTLLGSGGALLSSEPPRAIEQRGKSSDDGDIIDVDPSSNGDNEGTRGSEGF